MQKELGKVIVCVLNDSVAVFPEVKERFNFIASEKKFLLVKQLQSFEILLISFV